MDELPDKVLSARVTVLTASPEPRLKIPPPDAAVLSDRVPLVTVSVLPPRVQDATAVEDGRIHFDRGTGERRHPAVVVVDAAAILGGRIALDTSSR